MKLAILGGSFNPVHLGHIFLADVVLSSLKYDRVALVPAYRSPFKPGAEGMETSAEDRLEMIAAAIVGDPRLTVDDCELRRGGVSYTVDTLHDIISRYMPEDKPALIIGDDLAADFPKWHNSAEILELADIIIGKRDKSGKTRHRFPHTLINNEVMNISSQMVRQKIKAGENWKSLVPFGAGAIIESRRLYGFRGVTESDEEYQADILRVEAAARETLSAERFLHSRNTALFAWDLCRRCGMNPYPGYLAGIAHDLGKQLDTKDMQKLVKSDGQEISALEKKAPGLLHGKAAAILLRERFSINNKDVLEAVAVHTSGSENMGPLAKVIYIADKVEVSRTIDPILRKMCAEAELDDLFYAVSNKTISRLQSKKLDLSEETIRLLEKMKRMHR